MNENNPTWGDWILAVVALLGAALGILSIWLSEFAWLGPAVVFIAGSPVAVASWIVEARQRRGEETPYISLASRNWNDAGMVAFGLLIFNSLRHTTSLILSIVMMLAFLSALIGVEECWRPLAPTILSLMRKRRPRD